MTPTSVPDSARCDVPCSCSTDRVDAVGVVGARMLADGLPYAEQVVLDDVGHEPFVEEPDATFAAITTFFGTSA